MAEVGWVEGGALPLSDFGRSVILAESGGQIMPTTLLTAPPDFQTFRHP